MSAELELIADSAQRLFADHVDHGVRARAEGGAFDAAMWQLVADAGWPLMLAREADGGLALGWAEAAAVLHALGLARVPLPLAETLAAAQLLSLAGLALPAGGAPLTLIEQGRGNDLQLQPCEGGWQLSGSARRVPWGRHAAAAALALADGRIARVDLRTGPGLAVAPQLDPAGLPADTLRFEAYPCAALAANPLPLAQPAWTLGALTRAVMMAGALEWTLAQSVQYANERVQFGKPIGRNQALQQHLALMAGDVAAARIAAQVAVADLDAALRDGDGRAAAFSIAVAKQRCGEAATRAAAAAHQVHGAIGFTQEHALHFATRRLWAWRQDFGSDAYWAAELGRAAIEARAAGFWPGLTAKRLFATGESPA